MSDQTEDHPFNVPPIHVPVGAAPKLIGESRAAIFAAIKRGELTAFKYGSRTMLSYEQLRQRCENRPRGLPAQPKWLAEARAGKRATKSARGKRSSKRRQ